MKTTKKGENGSERMDEEIMRKTKPTFGRHWIRNAAFSCSNPVRRSEIFIRTLLLNAKVKSENCEVKVDNRLNVTCAQGNTSD